MGRGKGYYNKDCERVTLMKQDFIKKTWINNIYEIKKKNIW